MQLLLLTTSYSILTAFMSIQIKSPAEIEKMRTSGIALRKVHDAVKAAVRVGATTMDLERAAVAKIEELGAKSAFKGYHNYPAVLCTSVNHEVIHGIPHENGALREGDIVSVDCGVVVDGYYSDCAVTYRVGKVSDAVEKLLRVTEGFAVRPRLIRRWWAGGWAIFRMRCR